MSFLRDRREDEFKIRIREVTSTELDRELKMLPRVFMLEKPRRLSKNNRIRTVNFAKSICSEVLPGLTAAACVGDQIEGGARASWLQEQIDKVYFQVRHWVRIWLMPTGTLFVKPARTGKGWIYCNAGEDCYYIEQIRDSQSVKGLVFP
ncbi:MAG: hypothetical protein ACLR8P_13840 [Clostridium fessum]